MISLTPDNLAFLFSQSYEKLIEFSAIASKERSNLDGESLKKVGQIVKFLLHGSSIVPSTS